MDIYREEKQIPENENAKTPMERYRDSKKREKRYFQYRGERGEDTKWDGEFIKERERVRWEFSPFFVDGWIMEGKS